MTVLIAVPGSEDHAHRLGTRLGREVIVPELRQFPDGELYVRMPREALSGTVAIVGNLSHDNFLRVAFLAGTARDLGASAVGLVAPYLAYMRQDRRFHEGEAVSAVHFASLVSNAVDWMVTVEPHLHRIRTLDQIYSIPTTTVHVSGEIAAWIAGNVPHGVVVGPDAESRQWARTVAEQAGLPYVILRKVRLSGERVEVSVPDVDRWRDRTPILVDDVISTGHTMLETVSHLCAAGLRAPVCVAVHAVFAGAAYSALERAGVERVVTSTTIPHVSNGIDVSTPIAEATSGMLRR